MLKVLLNVQSIQQKLSLNFATEYRAFRLYFVNVTFVFLYIYKHLNYFALE